MIGTFFIKIGMLCWFDLDIARLECEAFRFRSACPNDPIQLAKGYNDLCVRFDGRLFPVSIDMMRIEVFRMLANNGKFQLKNLKATIRTSLSFEELEPFRFDGFMAGPKLGNCFGYFWDFFSVAGICFEEFSAVFVRFTDE